MSRTRKTMSAVEALRAFEHKHFYTLLIGAGPTAKRTQEEHQRLKEAAGEAAIAKHERSAKSVAKRRAG